MPPLANTHPSTTPFAPLTRPLLGRLISALVLGGSGTLPWSCLQAAERVEEVIVVDRIPYLRSESSIGKFTEPLRDTPQSITVLSSQLLEDRAAMSLNDALRNVPGITLGAGEFTWQGNNPNIRGFNARNDMFLDGMRDYGNYARDPFNLETIEVLQGPSSMVFGRGSTGGVINQASKQPLATSLRKLNINIGNASTYRVTTDINVPLPQLGDDAAFRLNLMKHEAEVPGRDGAKNDQYGIAPTLALGLGDATLLTLSYMRQSADSRPDYGLPWLAGAPAPVERHTWYGFNDDFVDTRADIANIRLDHRFSPTLRLNAQLRQADYRRASRIAEPLVAAGTTAQTPLADVVVNRNVFSGQSREEMLQGQVNLVAELGSGWVRHALVTGIEVAEEQSAPTMSLAVGVPSTSLSNPNRANYSATAMQVRARADTASDSKAAYILDTIKFGEQWQLVAGLRWDHFHTNYIADRFDADGNTNGTEQVLRKDVVLSYRGALVYKPAPEGSLYLGWGTSFNPSAEGLSFIANARNFGISNAFLEPERNRSVELGGKWELYRGRILAEGALFEIVKSNARVPDPANPGFNALAGEQTVRGLSLNLSGGIGDLVTVSGGYVWLDSEESRTAPSLDNLGRPLLNTPEHSFSGWLNYGLSINLELAGGARFVDERLARNVSPLYVAPSYWAFDLMGKYTLTDHITLKLNVTNLTDRRFHDQLHPFHVVPGPGRAVVFAINLNY